MGERKAGHLELHFWEMFKKATNYNTWLRSNSLSNQGYGTFHSNDFKLNARIAKELTRTFAYVHSWFSFHRKNKLYGGRKDECLRSKSHSRKYWLLDFQEAHANISQKFRDALVFHIHSICRLNSRTTW